MYRARSGRSIVSIQYMYGLISSRGQWMCRAAAMWVEMQLGINLLETKCKALKLFLMWDTRPDVRSACTHFHRAEKLRVGLSGCA